MAKVRKLEEVSEVGPVEAEIVAIQPFEVETAKPVTEKKPDIVEVLKAGKNSLISKGWLSGGKLLPDIGRETGYVSFHESNTGLTRSEFLSREEAEKFGGIVVSWDEVSEVEI